MHRSIQIMIWARCGYYNGDNAEEKTKMAQAMNLLMPGNTFLYYGEEIGMRGTANDETKRLAMRWSGVQKLRECVWDLRMQKETEQTYVPLISRWRIHTLFTTL